VNITPTKKSNGGAKIQAICWEIFALLRTTFTHIKSHRQQPVIYRVIGSIDESRVALGLLFESL